MAVGAEVVGGTLDFEIVAPAVTIGVLTGEASHRVQQLANKVFWWSFRKLEIEFNEVAKPASSTNIISGVRPSS